MKYWLAVMCLLLTGCGFFPKTTYYHSRTVTVVPKGGTPTLRTDTDVLPIILREIIEFHSQVETWAMETNKRPGDWPLEK